MTAAIDRPALAQEAAACRRLYVTPELRRARPLTWITATTQTMAGGSDEFA